MFPTPSIHEKWLIFQDLSPPQSIVHHAKHPFDKNVTQNCDIIWKEVLPPTVENVGCVLELHFWSVNCIDYSVFEFTPDSARILYENYYIYIYIRCIDLLVLVSVN
jgi:hypothetical protein